MTLTAPVPFDADSLPRYSIYKSANGNWLVYEGDKYIAACRTLKLAEQLVARLTA